MTHRYVLTANLVHNGRGLDRDEVLDYARDVTRTIDAHCVVADRSPVAYRAHSTVWGFGIAFDAASDVEAGAISRDALDAARAGYSRDAENLRREIAPDGFEAVAIPTSAALRASRAADAGNLALATCPRCGRDHVLGTPHTVRAGEGSAACR